MEPAESVPVPVCKDTVPLAPPVAAPEDKLIAPVVDSDEVPVAIVI